MAVSINWGSHFVGVLAIRAPLSGVYLRASDCFKLPYVIAAYERLNNSLHYFNLPGHRLASKLSEVLVGCSHELERAEELMYQHICKVCDEISTEKIADVLNLMRPFQKIRVVHYGLHSGIQGYAAVFLVVATDEN